MELEIRLYNEFKKYSPEDDHVFKLPIHVDNTVGDVLKALNIPADIPAVVLLNGRRVGAETRIEPQSRLVVFTPISGG